jgi:hypothetical protein
VAKINALSTGKPLNTIIFYWHFLSLHFQVLFFSGKKRKEEKNTLMLSHLIYDYWYLCFSLNSSRRKINKSSCECNQVLQQQDETGQKVKRRNKKSLSIYVR